jgi:hypothetical protein
MKNMRRKTGNEKIYAGQNRKTRVEQFSVE